MKTYWISKLLWNASRLKSIFNMSCFIKIGVSRLRQCLNHNFEKLTFKHIIELMKTCNLTNVLFKFGSQVCSNIFTQLYSDIFFINFYDRFYFSNLRFTFLWGQYMHARFCTIIGGFKKLLSCLHVNVKWFNYQTWLFFWTTWLCFHPKYLFTTWSKMITTLNLTKLLELCNFVTLHLF